MYNTKIETFNQNECVIIGSSKDEPYFELNNNWVMDNPIVINGLTFFTVESLYYVMLFPDNLEVQEYLSKYKTSVDINSIIQQFGVNPREDWDSQRKLLVMLYCISLKISNNWNVIAGLLLATGDTPLVVKNNKDTFWGVRTKVVNESYSGVNMLGQMLELFRAKVAQYKLTKTYTIQRPSQEIIINGKIVPLTFRGQTQFKE